ARCVELRINGSGIREDGLVERFKISFQISKSNCWVFEKDVTSKYSLRLPQLEYTRFPRASGKPPRASPCGVLPISFLPQESRIFHLLGWVFILNKLLYYSNSSKSIS